MMKTKEEYLEAKQTIRLYEDQFRIPFTEWKIKKDEDCTTLKIKDYVIYFIKRDITYNQIFNWTVFRCMHCLCEFEQLHKGQFLSNKSIFYRKDCENCGITNVINEDKIYEDQ